jgi:hypothetical protein
VPDVAWDTLRSFNRMHPTPTKQQQAALAKLQAQFDEADDEDGEAHEKLAAKLEKLESEIVFTAEEKAASGAIVTVPCEGELEIIAGLVRHEDRAAAKQKKVDAANGEADKAPRASPPSSSRI